MKSIHLFATRLRTLWVFIPPILLLIPTIIYNDDADSRLFALMNSNLKLYPLMIVLILTIIFMAIYFFRMVTIRIEEIRMVGPFSSKERVTLKKDCSLILTPLKRGRLRIEVYGICADNETYAWLTEDDFTEINLFRGVANGSERTVKRILSFFGVEHESIDKALTEVGVIADTKDFSLSVETFEDKKKIKLYFKETL